MILTAVALGALAIGALGYAMLRYLDGPRGYRPTEHELREEFFRRVGSEAKLRKQIARLESLRKHERSRSFRWLMHERNKRRDIEFCAVELERELEQYRSEERAAEARVWKWN